MRQLFANGNMLDLEEKTAIGLTFQSGDISEPCRNKLSMTNSFTLPFTANNKRRFEFADNPMSSSSLPYDKLIFDYYDGMIPVIKNSLGFLNQTNGKYNVSIVKGSDIIESLKKETIRSWLLQSCFPPLADNNLIIAGNNGIFNSEAQVYDALMLVIQPPIEFEHFKPITAAFETIGSGGKNGAIGLKISSLFDWVGTIGIWQPRLYYNIVFNGTTAQNTIFESLVIPMKDLFVVETSQGSGLYCLKYNGTINQNDLQWIGTKNIFDLIKSICNIFNAILDINENTNEIKITTFNKILESTSILDWSKKVVSNKPIVKKFTVGTWLQTNYINYKYDDGVNTTGGRITVTCSNNNIEFLKEIDNGLFIPRAYQVTSNDIFYLMGSSDISNNPLFTQKPITELCLFSLQGNTFGTFPVEIYQVLPLNFSSNYSGMRTILTNPITFEVDLYLNQLDMYNFTPEKLVKIDSLGGIFYVNKINGYNSKSVVGTKCELIKIR